MSLLNKFKSGIMTIFAGIEDNNGTTPSSLPQHGLEPTSYKNKSIQYGNNPQNPGKAVGSSLDLQDSGPINVPDNKHKQNFTPTNKYLDNI